MEIVADEWERERTNTVASSTEGPMGPPDTVEKQVVCLQAALAVSEKKPAAPMLLFNGALGALRAGPVSECGGLRNKLPTALSVSYV